ncbi:hypothetical protein [Candidatus Ichthyocystis hellenicum]|uniref:hypothetical protein n=2 Tax=Candidatus Ichthyocystis TaxID=2929841 RepID=UPI001112BF38|nr:hypothetical protein [Candidatus Ichthyocystis hellenicum]
MGEPIRVLNIIDVPMAALSISYKYITVSGDESSSSDSGSSSELGSSSSKLPVASSVSTSAIKEPSTAASSSYFRVPPKKLFIMQGLFSGSRTLEVPIGSDAAARPSSSASVDIGSVPLLVAAAAGTAADETDVGVRLAALLNRGLPPFTTSCR